MDLLHSLVDVVLHLDRHLNEWAGLLGPWLYLVVFAVVFAETGLVVTPFLPGDSLLFAIGALASIDGSPLRIELLLLLLFAAAVLGDAANYAIGKALGPRVFSREESWLLNKEHLVRTHQFYERHGGKAVFLARFVPIVRTFAPFVAGIGSMAYARFAMWNVSGAFVWVTGLTLAGFFFGRIDIVQRNFEVVIFAIIGLSLVPIVVEALRARRAGALAAVERERAAG
jgi:membrane-associated protein